MNADQLLNSVGLAGPTISKLYTSYGRPFTVKIYTGKNNEGTYRIGKCVEIPSIYIRGRHIEELKTKLLEAIEEAESYGEGGS